MQFINSFMTQVSPKLVNLGMTISPIGLSIGAALSNLNRTVTKTLTGITLLRCGHLPVINFFDAALLGYLRVYVEIELGGIWESYDKLCLGFQSTILAAETLDFIGIVGNGVCFRGDNKIYVNNSLTTNPGCTITSTSDVITIMLDSSNRFYVGKNGIFGTPYTMTWGTSNYYFGISLYGNSGKSVTVRSGLQVQYSQENAMYMG